MKASGQASAATGLAIRMGAMILRDVNVPGVSAFQFHGGAND